MQFGVELLDEGVEIGLCLVDCLEIAPAGWGAWMRDEFFGLGEGGRGLFLHGYINIIVR